MRHIATLTFAIAAAWGAVASAANWPHWRGPARDGTSPEPSGWQAVADGSGSWPARTLWTADVGAGCTSPIIAEGRLFTMGFSGDRRSGAGNDTVYCFDARTGQPLWRQSYPARYQSRTAAGDNGQYGGPLATPSFDAQTGWLYTLGVDGRLNCWDGRGDGRRIWTRDLHADFKITRRPDVGRGLRDFGFTCAPLVWGELLVVQVGDAAGTVVAFDKRTGAKRWSSQYRGPAGHSGGIVPTRIGSAEAFGVLTLGDLVLVRAQDGRTVRSLPYKTDFGCNLPTPAFSDGRVLLTSGYNHSHSVLVDLSGPPRQLWRSEGFAMVTSPVVVGGRAFLINDSLQCVDLAGGTLLWKGGRFGHGSIIAAADGKLLVFGSGRLTLVDAQADRYRQLAVVEGLVKGTCYPNLAFSDGLIACKDRAGALVCLSVGNTDDDG